ncbi:MAG: DUF4435 domain-containing protein [Candidatus Anammoxibacter sp.]
MKSGFPTIPESFYFAQDIFYDQFNAINFYVEDEKQENLYFQILKKIFSDIKLAKIFPLNGKVNVVTEAKLTIHDKTKVYIVDGDFDILLKKIENLPNLFYLKKYSIENYLLEKNAVHDLIIEENPRTRKKDIPRIFDFEKFLKESYSNFKEITAIYLVVQLHKLDIPNSSINPARFFNFNPHIALREVEFQSYKDEINLALQEKDRRYTINGQLRKQKSFLKDSSYIPGRYIIKYLKSRLSLTFSFQTTYDSFIFKLAINCNFRSLRFLKTSVTKFIS